MFKKVIYSNFSLEKRIFFAQISDKIFRSGVGILLSIYVARVLGPVDFGFLTFLLTVLGFTSILSTLGLNNYVLIGFSKKNFPDESIWALNVLVLRLAGAISSILITALFLYIYFEYDLHKVLLGSTIVASLLMQSFDLFESYYIANGAIMKVLRVRWIAFVIITFAKITACYFHASINLFALLYALDLGLLGLLYLILERPSVLYLSYKKVDLKIIKNILNSCYPIALSCLMVMFYMRFDQFLIKHHFGDRLMGVYAAAITIAELWTFVANALVIAFTVRLTGLLNCSDEKHAYKRFFCKLTRYAFWGSCLYSILVYSFAENIVQILYGTEFKSAASLLRTLCWVAPLISLGTLNSIWLIHNKAQMTWLAQTFAIGLLSIIINQLVVPVFGAVGAAYLCVLSQLLICFFINFIFSDTKELFYIQVEGIFSLKCN